MTKGKHCVTVMRMNPRVMRLFEQGKAPKPIWDVVGERCFTSKAARDRYVKKMSRFRPGRARIEVE
jgi:hypothetical protein